MTFQNAPPNLWHNSESSEGNYDSPPLVCSLLEQGDGVCDCGHGGDGSGPGDQLLGMLTGSLVCMARVGVSPGQPVSTSLYSHLTAVAMLLLISPPPPQQQHGVQLPLQCPAQTSLIHYKHYTITHNYTSLLLFRKPINKIVSVPILLFGWIMICI